LEAGIAWAAWNVEAEMATGDRALEGGGEHNTDLSTEEAD
jgi:hypothetical protein